MTQDEKRVAIAEACGIKAERYFNKDVWIYGGKMHYWPPKYFNDLNVCHEMEKALSSQQRRKYIESIFNLPTSECESNTFATATQRAEAFGKTLNLW